MIGTLNARRERGLLFVLAGVQVTHILDFMVMMPLGPQFMRLFDISPAAFGVLVSAYTVSAGAFGFLGSFIADRFDRRKLLLGLYLGFAAATLLCGIAEGYAALLAARAAAGAFGGMLGSTVFAIVGDVIPEARRGAALGVVMTAFALSAVAGVPAGLWLAATLNWRATFLVLAVISLAIWIGAWRLVPPIAAHLDGAVQGGPLTQMRSLLLQRACWTAFGFTMVLTFSAFSVIPYIAPYWVGNVGLAEQDLTVVYFFGGAATFFTSRFIGRLADRHGTRKVFAVTALLSLVPILAVTHAPPMPLWGAVLFSVPFFVLVSGRFVPAMALLSAVPEPRSRGSFMSFNASVQQIGMALGAAAGGALIGRSPDGTLSGFGTVGVVAAGLTCLAIALAIRVRSATERQAAEGRSDQPRPRIR